MSYVPFTNDYSSIRTPAFVAAETARNNARRQAVKNIIVNGNQVMGNLVTDCCSDPAYGGYGFVDDGSTSPATASAAVPPDAAAITAAIQNYKLTPNDILSGTNGFPIRKDGRPWPRPRGSARDRWNRINAFPNYTSGSKQITSLVPPCPCFSNAPPIPMAVPQVMTSPPPPAPAPVAATSPTPAPAASCPYPACSTGNVCLDLVTGCVFNSQIDPGQQQACALANYGVFGNKGLFLGQVIHGCQPPPYLGTPLPNPPQADPSMMTLIDQAMQKNGMAGLGQDTSTSNLGGFLAIVGLFGIVVWATRK